MLECNRFIIKAAQLGNKDAVQIVYDMYEKQIWSIVRKFSNYFSTPELREEAFAEGCEVFAKAIKKYDWKKGNNFSTYLERAITNHFIRFVQKKQKEIITISMDEYLYINQKGDKNLSLEDVIGEKEQGVSKVELKDAITRALNKLDDKERDLTISYFLNGTPQTILCKKYNVSNATISRWLDRIRVKLQRELAVFANS